MNKLFQIFLLLLSLKSLQENDEKPPDHHFDLKKYKLNQKLKEIFSQDPEKNPFLKALEGFPNDVTEQEAIEKVLGRDFSLIKEETHSAKEYAMLLVKEDMKQYEETNPFGNTQLTRIFKDFYDLMDLQLSPDTLFLNKDSYVFFWEIPESQFVTVYTMLSELYEGYSPLERHINKTEKAFLKLVHKIVLLKCPDYEHREPETFSLGANVDVDGPVVEESFTPKKVSFDKDQLNNIFKVLHKPKDKDYVFHFKSAKLYSIMFLGFSLVCLI